MLGPTIFENICEVETNSFEFQWSTQILHLAAMAEAFLRRGGGGKTNDQIFFTYDQGGQWRSKNF